MKATHSEVVLHSQARAAGVLLGQLHHAGAARGHCRCAGLAGAAAQQHAPAGLRVQRWDADADAAGRPSRLLGLARAHARSFMSV